jgi:hypothetical protein
MRASHKLNKTSDRGLIEQRRDELVRRAAIADHGHGFVAKIEGMIPPSTVEDFSGEVFDSVNLIRAFRNITESDGGDQEPCVPEIHLTGVKVDQSHTPV